MVIYPTRLMTIGYHASWISWWSVSSGAIDPSWPYTSWFWKSETWFCHFRGSVVTVVVHCITTNQGTPFLQAKRFSLRHLGCAEIISQPQHLAESIAPGAIYNAPTRARLQLCSVSVARQKSLRGKSSLHNYPTSMNPFRKCFRSTWWVFYIG